MSNKNQNKEKNNPNKIVKKKDVVVLYRNKKIVYVSVVK